MFSEKLRKLRSLPARYPVTTRAALVSGLALGAEFSAGMLQQASGANQEIPYPVIGALMVDVASSIYSFRLLKGLERRLGAITSLAGVMAAATILDGIYVFHAGEVFQGGNADLASRAVGLALMFEGFKVFAVNAAERGIRGRLRLNSTTTQ